MSLDLLILIAVLACVAVWYFRRDRAKERPAAALAQPESPQQPIPTAKAKHVVDPFLEEIASVKHEADAQVENATHAHEQNLEARFSEDLKLKERLSRFDREQDLDQALIGLWEEVKHYPAWIKREDFEKWDKLKLVNVEGSEAGESESISFSHETQRYTISVREWHGMEGDTYADFSLHEDGKEVFGIRCSVQYEEYGTSYRCLDITAFKKRRNWAQLLLDLHRRIRIEENKTSAEFKYFGADEIKSRFEE